MFSFHFATAKIRANHQLSVFWHFRAFKDMGYVPVDVCIVRPWQCQAVETLAFWCQNTTEWAINTWSLY